MLPIVTAVHVFLLTRLRSRHPERGQATAEYALVLIAAATVALILLAWATKSGRIGKLFDIVFDALISKVK